MDRKCSAVFVTRQFVTFMNWFMLIDSQKVGYCCHKLAIAQLIIHAIRTKDLHIFDILRNLCKYYDYRCAVTCIAFEPPS